MGLFSIFRRKRTDEIPALKHERPGIGTRLAKAGQKKYIVKMAMTYEGKPQRHFEVTMKARSRDNAAYLAKEKISFEVVSAQLDRRKK